MTTKPLSLLLVEDNPADARLARELLRDGGVAALSVTSAARLEEALALLRENNFSAIVLDLGLPDCQGLETFARVHSEAPEVPILVLTGLHDEELAMGAVAAGAQDYLVKGQVDGHILGHAVRFAIERKTTEGRIRSLTLALDQSPASALITDRDGAIEYVNKKFVETTGYSAQEVIGQTPRLLKSGQTPDETYRAMWRALAEGETWSGDLLNRRKSGELYWDAVRISPVRNGTGAIQHFVSVQEDITVRKRAEETLRKGEERYRTLFESSPLPKWLYDVETLRFLEVNDAAVQSYGYSREEFLNMTILDIRPPETVGAVLSDVEKSALDNRAFGVWTHKTKDGALLQVEVSGHSFEMEGRAARLVVAQDITERLRAEKALRVSETRFSRLAESGAIGIATADLLGNVHQANQACLDMLGFSLEDLLAGKVAWGPLTPPEWKTLDAEAAALLKERGVAPAWEKELIRKDGTRVPILIGAAMLDPPDCIAFIADLTVRKRAEREARLLLTTTLAVNQAADLASALRVVLQKVCEATGWVTGTAWTPQKDGAVLVSAATWGDGRFKALSEGRTFAPGQGLPGSVWSSQKAAWVGDPEVGDLNRGPLARALGIRAGMAVPVRAGDEVMAVLEFFVLEPREDDEPLMRLVTAVAAQLASVIRRRQAEEALRASEDQLRQAQKMEAIGSLAGGVAHDFNNILSVILTYSDLLLDVLQPESPMRADLEEIKKAGQRAADLTRHLLAFSRRQILEPRITDFNQILTGMEKMLRRLIGEDVELTMIPWPSPARVNVDPGQMEQVIMNLAINARDAMPEGGKLTIEIGEALLDESHASKHGTKPGPHVMLAVSDTGIGMDAATQARVFEPFFTTKEIGKGTGLGLATVFGIVRQSGGSIWLYSEPGKGTSFKVYLPMVLQDVEAARVQSAGPASLAGTETILLVEDEDGVRKVARAILERAGYRVLEARSGDEALLLCGQHPSFHLLLTDVVMPRMSGAQLAAQLLKLRPGLKVIYMSGYTDNAVVLHGVLHAKVAFVQKPITPLALLTRLREVLDAPPPPAKAS